ncbi:MAG: molybdopterin-dependent oxidoreductase [Bacteroidales bacterium]|nr:molybdopterin-dependent oxidoreductase [Bacteroidales bacterium]
MTPRAQFVDNAAATSGRSMIIIGAGEPLVPDTDMVYRSAINMLYVLRLRSS